jgi:hypothetical protein
MSARDESDRLDFTMGRIKSKSSCFRWKIRVTLTEFEGVGDADRPNSPGYSLYSTNSLNVTEPGIAACLQGGKGPRSRQQQTFALDALKRDSVTLTEFLDWRE